MHVVICALVGASTHDDALATGKTVFDRLVGADPHAGAVFDYYVTFDEVVRERHDQPLSGFDDRPSEFDAVGGLGRRNVGLLRQYRLLDSDGRRVALAAVERRLEDGVLYDDGSYVGAHSDDPNGYFHHNGGTDYSSYEDQIHRNLYDLADFDQSETFVDSYLKNAVRRWLDTGLDGLRIGAVAHMPPKCQKTFIDAVYDHQQVFAFGEWFLGADEHTSNYYEFSNDSGMSLRDFRFGQEIGQTLREFTDDFNGLRDVLQETASEHGGTYDQVLESNGPRGPD